MIKVKNLLFNLIASNFALVFVAIFTGLIVSCVAQIFMYSGKKVFEIEQVCVGTNTMSYDDYLDCRNFSFFVRLFAQQIFTPIHKLTKKLGISWFYFIKEIYNIVKNKDFSGKLKDI